jgi:N-acetylated-alpha-linked acidic dipeptidase
VLDEWRERAWTRTPMARRPATPAALALELKALGSGADFVPFQDHLAVPTLAIEFIGDNGYGFGTYHSSFDSRAYVERVADPGFEQGVTMTRVLGTLALRMAGADVLPFRFSHYAEQLERSLRDAAGWGRDSLGASRVALDLAPLLATAERVRRLAADVERGIDTRLARAPFPAARARALNDRLARLEQLLADDDGAPDARWYRHVFYGWNIYSLYDGQPFPGLAEAIRLGDQGRSTHEVGRIARALERMAASLTEAYQITAGADGD